MKEAGGSPLSAEGDGMDADGRTWTNSAGVQKTARGGDPSLLQVLYCTYLRLSRPATYCCCNLDDLHCAAMRCNVQQKNLKNRVVPCF